MDLRRMILFVSARVSVDWSLLPVLLVWVQKLQ
jgi:hypothetical protein